mmetsp:Transcript_18848/g.34183  ORF Transcript_18848/g.34183 Transcript_18848/m.34183 type:complete len:275 (-) Transcript_18848:542-1366(-)
MLPLQMQQDNPVDGSPEGLDTAISVAQSQFGGPSGQPLQEAEHGGQHLPPMANGRRMRVMHEPEDHRVPRDHVESGYGSEEGGHVTHVKRRDVLVQTEAPGRHENVTVHQNEPTAVVVIKTFVHTVRVRAGNGSGKATGLGQREFTRRGIRNGGRLQAAGLGLVTGPGQRGWDPVFVAFSEGRIQRCLVAANVRKNALRRGQFLRVRWNTVVANKAPLATVRKDAVRRRKSHVPADLLVVVIVNMDVGVKGIHGVGRGGARIRLGRRGIQFRSG